MTPVCRECRGTGLLTKTDEFGEEYVTPCQCKAQALHKARVTRWREKLGVWPRERQYTFNQYGGERSRNCVALLENYVNNFEQFRSHSIYVYGPPGTQKTTVLQWVAYQLIEKGIRARWSSMPQLLSKLTSSSSFHSDAVKAALDAEIKDLQTVDLLILDESFDKSKSVIWGAGTQISLVDTFLRARLQDHGKPCIFISNVAPERIAAELGSIYLESLVQRNLSARLEFLDPAPVNEHAGKASLWDFQKKEED